jgi:hypothetical protein
MRGRLNGDWEECLLLFAEEKQHRLGNYDHGNDCFASKADGEPQCCEYWRSEIRRDRGYARYVERMVVYQLREGRSPALAALFRDGQLGHPTQPEEWEATDINAKQNSRTKRQEEKGGGARRPWAATA